MVHAITLCILFVLELLYFKIAKRFAIVDIPNNRSSHVGVVVRGGGIIFPISVLLQEIYLGFPNPYFSSGLILISGISFVDDIKSLPNRVRLLVHFLTISLLLLELNLVGSPWWILFLFAILITGFVNAFNFMDGINGITGTYGLVTTLSFAFINEYIQPFIDTELVLFVLLGLVVFNYFNFRVKARCFAGDVGSISLAYILAFFLFKLYISFDGISPILLLMVSIYGVDSVWTIIKRVSRGENIFMPHRSHAYQILVHRKNWGHLQVSSLYAIMQLIINIGVILCLNLDPQMQIILTAFTLIILSIAYWLIGRDREIV